MVGGSINMSNIRVLLSDVERNIIHTYIMPSPIDYVKTIPLVSKNGRNILICEVKSLGEGRGYILLFNWHILHEPYWDIRRRCIETDTVSPCVTNMFLEREFYRWMVRADWRKSLPTLIQALRIVLEGLDEVLVVFDDLVKRCNINMGEHASCYFSTVSFSHAKINYFLNYGQTLKQSYRGEIKGIFGGEICITRSKKNMSLGIDFGINFGISHAEVNYELFVRGGSEPLLKYVDAMLVEDDL
jgi:hypothetical protein